VKREQKVGPAEILPGLTTEIWGYNCIFSGPTLNANSQKAVKLMNLPDFASSAKLNVFNEAARFAALASCLHCESRTGDLMKVKRLLIADSKSCIRRYKSSACGCRPSERQPVAKDFVMFAGGRS